MTEDHNFAKPPTEEETVQHEALVFESEKQKVILAHRALLALPEKNDPSVLRSSILCLLDEEHRMKDEPRLMSNPVRIRDAIAALVKHEKMLKASNAKKALKEFLDSPVDLSAFGYYPSSLVRRIPTLAHSPPRYIHWKKSISLKKTLRPPPFSFLPSSAPRNPPPGRPSLPRCVPHYIPPPLPATYRLFPPNARKQIAEGNRNTAEEQKNEPPMKKQKTEENKNTMSAANKAITVVMNKKAPSLSPVKKPTPLPASLPPTSSPHLSPLPRPSPPRPSPPHLSPPPRSCPPRPSPPHPSPPHLSPLPRACPPRPPPPPSPECSRASLFAFQLPQCSRATPYSGRKTKSKGTRGQRVAEWSGNTVSKVKAGEHGFSSPVRNNLQSSDKKKEEEKKEGNFHDYCKIIDIVGTTDATDLPVLERMPDQPSGKPVKNYSEVLKMKRIDETMKKNAELRITLKKQTFAAKRSLQRIKKIKEKIKQLKLERIELYKKLRNANAALAKQNGCSDALKNLRSQLREMSDKSRLSENRICDLEEQLAAANSNRFPMKTGEHGGGYVKEAQECMLSLHSLGIPFPRVGKVMATVAKMLGKQLSDVPERTTVKRLWTAVHGEPKMIPARPPKRVAIVHDDSDSDLSDMRYSPPPSFQ